MFKKTLCFILACTFFIFSIDFSAYATTIPLPFPIVPGGEIGAEGGTAFAELMKYNIDELENACNTVEGATRNMTIGQFVSSPTKYELAVSLIDVVNTAGWDNIKSAYNEVKGKVVNEDTKKSTITANSFLTELDKIRSKEALQSFLDLSTSEAKAVELEYKEYLATSISKDRMADLELKMKVAGMEQEKALRKAVVNFSYKYGKDIFPAKDYTKVGIPKLGGFLFDGLYWQNNPITGIKGTIYQGRDSYYWNGTDVPLTNVKSSYNRFIQSAIDNKANIHSFVKPFQSSTNKAINFSSSAINKGMTKFLANIPRFGHIQYDAPFQVSYGVLFLYYTSDGSSLKFTLDKTHVINDNSYWKVNTATNADIVFFAVSSSSGIALNGYDCLFKTKEFYIDRFDPSKIVGGDILGNTFPLEGDFVIDSVLTPTLDDYKSNVKQNVLTIPNVVSLPWDVLAGDDIVGVAGKVLTGVKDGTISLPIAGDVLGELNPPKEDDKPIVLPSIFDINIASIFDQTIAKESGFNFDPIRALGSAITNKFPFSLPWDFMNLIGKFLVEPKAPKYVANIDFLGMGYSKGATFEFDLSPFDNIAEIFRFFFSAYFVYCLIQMTGTLTKH